MNTSTIQLFGKKSIGELSTTGEPEGVFATRVGCASLYDGKKETACFASLFSLALFIYFFFFWRTPSAIAAMSWLDEKAKPSCHTWAVHHHQGQPRYKRRFCTSYT